MSSFNNIEKIKENTVQIIPYNDLLKKLEKNQKLNVKLGADPTAPDLHLGHVIVLEKMKFFQDLDHNIIFLIGDFTARIGDPTGRIKTRPALSENQIIENTKTYFDQVSKILDPQKIQIRFNSEWLDKLTAKELTKLCGQVTLAQLTEREDFSNRIKNNQPISMHELLYPLFQGYDSVALKADIELGGTDQTFNLLMGRHLQEKYHQEPQVIVTTPLLEGIDGGHKMSKSLGNSISLNESASEAYGKLMSISDNLMWHYYKLLLKKEDKEIQEMKHSIEFDNVNPMILKKYMAYQILTKYWSKEEAEIAQQTFESLFQKKDYSAAQLIKLPKDISNPIWIVDLLKLIGAIKTSSEAKRLISEEAVKINEESISDFKSQINLTPNMIVKVGKHRIYKISI